MRINKRLRKAFTLVELVVVIAIIAILSTVSVVTYFGITSSAKKSVDNQTITQWNQLLLLEEELGNKCETPSEAVEIIKENGWDVAKLTPTYEGNEILWNDTTNRFSIISKDTVNSLKRADNGDEKWHNWRFLDNYADNNGYSVYLRDQDFSSNLDLTIATGLDVGDNTEAFNITYNTTDAKTVSIRTNGGTLIVEATDSTISHYGMAASVEFNSVSGSTLNEFGEVQGNITLNKGTLNLKDGSSINSVVLTSTDLTDVKVSQSTNSQINGTVIALDENVKNELASSSSIEVKKDVLEVSSNVVLINSENQGNLKKYIDEEKYCLFTSDVKYDTDISIDNKKFVLDLNNYTLTFYQMELVNQSNGTIKNGILISKKSGSSIVVMDGNKLTMEGVNLTNKNAYGIFPNEKAEVILKNTKIKAGVYALGTNASTAQVNSPLINISAYNCEFVTETSDFDNSAVYINVPVVAYFEGCSFNGGRQAVFVRGGTATFKDCTMTVSGKFSSMNKYFETTWGTGNELPTAALTIGNRSTSAYNYSTNVTLLNTKLEVLNNADSMYALYAYGLTKDNYTVTLSYDNNSVLGKTNLNDEIGNVVVTRL